MVTDRTKLPVLGVDPQFRFPGVERRMLTNGVRLWSVDHRHTSLFTLLLLIPSGSAADPLARPGLAALTADLLDEGSGDRSGIEFHEALGRIGGHFRTEVTSDATLLSVTALARHANEAIALLVEVVTRPLFATSEFTRVRDLRLHRLTQLRQVPAVVAERAYLETLYGAHPYGHLAIGTNTSLRALTTEDVAAFHAEHYAPSRWTLIAVGGGEGAEMRGLADQLLDSVPVSPSADAAPPSPHGPPAPPPPRDRLVFIPRVGAVQSEIWIGHLGATRRTVDYHALLLMNMVLGGQFVSRLNLNLREDKGYTYGTRTVFDCRLGRGPFTFQASVQTSATADAIRQVVREISDIRDKRPVTPAEVAMGCAALTRGFPRNFETAGQIAVAVAKLALFDLPPNYFSEFVRRVAAVDVAEVTRVASVYLKPEKLVAVVVGSRAEVLASLSNLGFGEPVQH